MPKTLEPMPKALQVFLLKKRFGNLDLIDWNAIVDGDLTFPENLHNIERNHIEEIEHAQHEGGYKTESEKKVELADIAWAKELEQMWRLKNLTGNWSKKKSSLRKILNQKTLKIGT